MKKIIYGILLALSLVIGGVGLYEPSRTYILAHLGYEPAILEMIHQTLLRGDTEASVFWFRKMDFGPHDANNPDYDPETRAILRELWEAQGIAVPPASQ